MGERRHSSALDRDKWSGCTVADVLDSKDLRISTELR